MEELGLLSDVVMFLLLCLEARLLGELCALRCDAVAVACGITCTGVGRAMVAFSLLQKKGQQLGQGVVVSTVLPVPRAGI